MLILIAGCGTSAAYASGYVYDANGRLIAVTTGGIGPLGSTTEYTYDAVGNILSIKHLSAGQLALFTFSPILGVTGSQVTIEGNGFSATPTNDTVKFNGVVAAVVSATANQIVANVPSSATTGPISVTVNSNTVTSTSNFTIVEAPAITGFTPGVADAGTPVTVSGTGLDPIPGETSLTLGGFSVPFTSLTDTSAGFSVPVNAGSGPIQIMTPGGQATSSTDLIVAPSGIGAANIVSYAMLTDNGSTQNLNINSTSKYGVFVFNATAGQYLSVQLSALTTSPSGGTISYYIYSPTNTQISSGTVSAASNMTINLPVIPMTGAYLVAFASGTHTVQLTAGLEVNATLQINGTPLGLSTTTPAQNKRFIFTGTTGQNLGLGLTNIVFNPTSGAAASLYVYNPSGSLLTSNGSCFKATIYNGCGANLSLAQTGTYSVVVDPPNGSVTMSFTATLSPDVPGIGTLLSPNVPYPLNVQYSGQRGLMSFTASAGQTVALEVSGITTNPANNSVNLYVYGPGGYPNGNPIASDTTATGYTFNLPNLPAGTYTVFIVPQYAVTATMTVTLVPQ